MHHNPDVWDLIQTSCMGKFDCSDVLILLAPLNQLQISLMCEYSRYAFKPPPAKKTEDMTTTDLSKGVMKRAEHGLTCVSGGEKMVGFLYLSIFLALECYMCKVWGTNPACANGSFLHPRQ